MVPLACSSSLGEQDAGLINPLYSCQVYLGLLETNFFTPVAKELEIAVIGLGCRFAGGIDSPEALWSALDEGRCLLGEFDAKRWEHERFYHPSVQVPGTYYAPRAGMLRDLDQFDAAFFNISAPEATQLDPQQRLMLEMTWEAFERAGLPADALSGQRAGVYVGTSANDFAWANTSHSPEGQNAYSMLGTTLSVVANRVSHFFNLQGPSLIVDTACSSALVAVDQAVHAMRHDGLELAVAGSVHLLYSPYPYVGFSRARMLSPTGLCHSFGSEADGYVRAEGGGVLVLKPLAQAQADGDPIWAVIRGSGTGNDGHTPVISAPSADRQEELLHDVYREFDLDPEQLSYLEAHGTGTPIGDPLEAQAIGKALGQKRDSKHRLPMGSVKSNLGHLEPASGMAGTMKAIGVLTQRQIPASLHAEELNPDINFDDLNLELVREKRSLDQEDPLLVGVSSFGFGGTNAHLVLEEAPTAPPLTKTEAEKNWLVPLSAKSSEALKAMASRYADYLHEHPTTLLADLAYTTSQRRSHLSHRLAVNASSVEELQASLQTYAEKGAAPNLVANPVLTPAAKIAFVFAGHGSLGPEENVLPLIYDPAVQPITDELFTEIQRITGIDPAAELQQPAEDRVMPQTMLEHTLVTLIQATTAHLLSSHGLVPDACVGHSMGEVGSLWTAGGITPQQAAQLIVTRATIQERTRGQGRMLAASLSPEAAQEEIERANGAIELAAINSPKAVTLVGDEEALLELIQRLHDRRVIARMLDGNIGYHSKALQPYREEFLQVLESQNVGEISCPFYSSVTGNRCEAADITPEFWWTGARHTVQFYPAIDALIQEGFSLFLEIGGYPALQSYIRHALHKTKATGRPLHAYKSISKPVAQTREAVATAHTLGAQLNWRTLFPQPGRTLNLPTYPWQKQSYWYKTDSKSDGSAYRRPDGPLLGTPINKEGNAWEQLLDVERHPWLADHQAAGSVVFPATGYLEVALEAARTLFPDGALDVRYLEIFRPMALDPGTYLVLRTTYQPATSTLLFETRPHASTEEPSLVAKAILGVSDAALIPPLPADVIAPSTPAVPSDGHYAALQAVGLPYGPAFQTVATIQAGKQGAQAQLQAPTSAPEFTHFLLDPRLADGALQVIFAAIQQQLETTIAQAPLYLPYRIQRTLVVSSEPAHTCRVQLHPSSPSVLLADLDLLDGQGEPVAFLRGVHLAQAQASRGEAGLETFQTVAVPVGGTTTATLPTPAELLAAAEAVACPDQAAAVQASLNRALELSSPPSTNGHRPPTA